MSPRDLPSRILKRAAKASVIVAPELAEQAAAYVELLARWNQKINLTALHVDPPNDEAIDRLIVEPLAAVRHFLPGDRRVTDVGSGGGSPALPLKLARPDLHFTLVESKVRKAAFLREAIRHLQLSDIDVENRRVEDLAAPGERELSDVVTLRAVRIDAERLRALRTLLKPGGRLFAFAGPELKVAAFEYVPEAHVLVPSLASRLIIARL